MSKVKAVTASQASDGPIPVNCRIPSMRLERLPCETSTPFGLPVEPEV